MKCNLTKNKLNITYNNLGLKTLFWHRFLLQDQNHPMEDEGPVIVNIVLQWCKFLINLRSIRINWYGARLGDLETLRGLGTFGRCPILPGWWSSFGAPVLFVSRTHIPASGFTQFHWSTGGSNASRSAAMHHQRQRRRRLLASKLRCKKCWIRWVKVNVKQKIFFVHDNSTLLL